MGSARSAYTASRSKACRNPRRPAWRTSSPLSVPAASASGKPPTPKPSSSDRVSGRPAAASSPASARPGGGSAPSAARTALRRFGGGAVLPVASGLMLSTASRGLPSAAAITLRTVSSSSRCADDARAAIGQSGGGEDLLNHRVHPAAALVDARGRGAGPPLHGGELLSRA